jgi:hypothetical protein
MRDRCPLRVRFTGQPTHTSPRLKSEGFEMACPSSNTGPTRHVSTPAVTPGTCRQEGIALHRGSDAKGSDA